MSQCDKRLSLAIVNIACEHIGIIKYIHNMYTHVSKKISISLKYQ